MAATTLDGALDPLPGRLDDLAEGVAGQVGQLLALELDHNASTGSRSGA